MDSKIYIPKRIRVGFNDRSDTYTGKLGYVIYYDDKGVLRKETSWNTWINNGYRSRDYQRDENGRPIIGADGRFVMVEDPGVEEKRNYRPEYTNEPIEGFVLNKKAGGDRYGWNPRQTYCRVYDPRGFEFEITIPNLLYILENTNSIVGKGLEGKFVYGWQGKELILIPEKSLEYEEMVKYTALQSAKVEKKDLVAGCLYRTKDLGEYMYIGFLVTHETKYIKNKTTGKYEYANVSKKKHWFYDIKNNKFIIRTDYKNLSEIIDANVYHDYANIMDELEHHSSYSLENPGKAIKEEVDISELEPTATYFPLKTYQYLTLEYSPGNFIRIGNYLNSYIYDENHCKKLKLKALSNTYWGATQYERKTYLQCIKNGNLKLYINTPVLQNGKLKKY